MATVLRAYQYPAVATHATTKMQPTRAIAVQRERGGGASAHTRDATTARTISAGIAALTLTPSPKPLSNAAYQASPSRSRPRSLSRSGIANTNAAKRAAAWARSASEKLEAMTPTRGDVASRTTGTAQAPDRQPSRRRSSMTPAATRPA